MECENNSPDTSKEASERAECRSRGHIYNNVRFFKIFTAASAVILSALCAVLFALFFDRDSMYFTGALYGRILLGVALLFCIATAVLSAVSSDRCAPSYRRASVWLGLFSGLEMVHLIIFLISEEKNWLLAILSLTAILFFMGTFHKNITAYTLLGILTVAWCVVIIAITYFSNAIPVNSPFKLLFQIAVAVSMLLVISEVRYALDADKPKIYKFFAAISFCLNLAAAVSGIVLSFGDLSADISLYAFSSCALTLYCARFFLAHKTSDSTQNTSNTETYSEEAEADPNSALPCDSSTTQEGNKDDTQEGDMTNESSNE